MTAAEYKKALETLANKCSFVENNFGDINLFGILGIQRNEVLICRVLGFLLTPNSIEGIGTEPLRTFLSQIPCARTYTDHDLQTASVVLEEHIDNDRRVDVVIYVDKDVYPIEVKVDTGDQEAQLFDYYHYYKKNSKITKIFYLTPNGRSPSDKSIYSPKRMEQLPTNVIHCLSFQEDIREWLSELCEKHPVEDNYGFLINQFKEVIQVMCANSKNQDALYEALGLNQTDTFIVTNEMKTALNIMYQQENLWKKIRNAYLRAAFEFPRDKYQLVETPNGSIIDEHSVYVIKKTDTEEDLAWICVHTNLYIVSKCSAGDLKGDNGYFWKYISPKGNRAFSLNRPTPSISDGTKIDISRLLEQIDSALSNQE